MSEYIEGLAMFTFGVVVALSIVTLTHTHDEEYVKVEPPMIEQPVDEKVSVLDYNKYFKELKACEAYTRDLAQDNYSIVHKNARLSDQNKKWESYSTCRTCGVCHDGWECDVDCYMKVCHK